MELLAFDLDGTLLNNAHEISPANRQAILDLVGKGSLIAIATGRSAVSVREIVADLGIEAFALALNGSYIEHLQNSGKKTLRRAVLRREVVRQAFQFAQEQGITFITSNEFGSDRVIFNDSQELVQEFLIKRSDLRVLKPEDMWQKINDSNIEYLKLAFTAQNVEKLNELQNTLTTVGINSFFSDRYYIEITPYGVNKGNALTYICDYLGISLKNTIAFGDQENDIELLQVSGMGVAMGNAVPNVQKLADFVTDTNDQDGVSKFLAKISLS
ncbi:Cof-type HAD-IIB family hydrolase [Enterococcus faecium]|uniref:Cof-type HAD-IIB family hydrolase n=1 Tax=Enterococcus faecium TaxID=1352 RepID=UPI0023B25823|nr:Cof-type HAD-IIB family hydrolase [Enterococcus faecium]